MRTVAELTDVSEPAWPLVAGWASAGGATVLSRDPEASARCLERLQVTTRSVLGALAHECGGVLVDHGWLRLLGGGPELPDLASASGLPEPSTSPGAPPFLVVALDVLGGRFAVNGGGLPGDLGETCFFAPDTLAWEPLGKGHGALVQWALTGGLAAFYADLRWRGWEREAEALRLDQGIAVYPALFSAEAAADLDGTSRRAVPFEELLALQDSAARQLDQSADGGPFQVVVQD